jgi:hypothetical protein
MTDQIHTIHEKVIEQCAIRDEDEKLTIELDKF